MTGLGRGSIRCTSYCRTYLFDVVSWNQSHWLVIFIVGCFLLCFPPVIFAFLKYIQQLSLPYLELVFALRLVIVQGCVYSQEPHSAAFGAPAIHSGRDHNRETATATATVTALSVTRVICNPSSTVGLSARGGVKRQLLWLPVLRSNSRTTVAGPWWFERYFTASVVRLVESGWSEGAQRV